MFPNPQSALPLPPRPNLEQYKKLAKELVKASKSGDPQAIDVWAKQWVKALTERAQLKLTLQMPMRVEEWSKQVTEFARGKLAGNWGAKCTLAGAQFVIARCHGFESWAKFGRNLESLARANSDVSQFELAADAIVSGELATLRRLVKENPKLARARSARAHGATLLHYVSANGVEGYRQKTPKNIVEIAKFLLDAGADVNASAEVYGGSTALGLVATSIYPQQARVQNALLELLLKHGAAFDDGGGGRSPIVVACLANGRREAAIFLAQRGAPLDLEGAAGVGRLDAVKTFFHSDGSLKPASLKPGANRKQLQRGFLWACASGCDGVVAFLLDHGAELSERADTGQTGLHWAVVGGNLSTIKLLIERGAPLEERNAYGGTALGQALWSFIHGDPEIDYASIVEMLLAARAKIETGLLGQLEKDWLEKEWLQEGKVRAASAKNRILEALRRYGATTEGNYD